MKSKIILLSVIPALAGCGENDFSVTEIYSDERCEIRHRVAIKNIPTGSGTRHYTEIHCEGVDQNWQQIIRLRQNWRFEILPPASEGPSTILYRYCPYDGNSEIGSPNLSVIEARGYTVVQSPDNAAYCVAERNAYCEFHAEQAARLARALGDEPYELAVCANESAPN